MTTNIVHIYCGNNFDCGDIMQDCREMGLEAICNIRDDIRTIILNLRNLNHVGLIIIEYSALKATPDSVITMQRLFGGTLAVLADESVSREELRELLKAGFNNIIDPETCIRQALIQILEGSYFYKLHTEENSTESPKRGFFFNKKKEETEIPILPTKPLRIGFAGVSHGSGTTHHALAFALYLQSAGKNVCYIQTDTDEIEKEFKLWTNVYSENNSVKYLSSLAVYSKNFADTINEKYDVYVEDYGTPSEYIPNFFLCDACIFVSAARPWNLSSISRIYTNLPISSKNIFLMNHTSPSERSDISELFEKVKVFYTEFEPDVFLGENNNRIYENLYNYLSEASHEE